MIVRIIAFIFVYMLFWVVAAFMVMPFGNRTYHDDAGADLVPGQTESAPSNFRPGRIMLRTTVVATLAFALFVANYYRGWVTIDSFSLVNPPASFMASTY